MNGSAVVLGQESSPLLVRVLAQSHVPTASPSWLLSMPERKRKGLSSQLLLPAANSAPTELSWTPLLPCAWYSNIHNIIPRVQC